MTDAWIEKKLIDVATLQRGFDLPHRARKPGDNPIVTSSGIEHTHAEAKVWAPGVVTGRYGTIGDVFYLEKNFWPLNTTLYVKDFHENSPLFIYYLLRTIDFATHSGKSGVPGVNRNDLHQESVLIPRTQAEQDAIAEALSDADALIESLEQLIAKKRQIKQGAMQQLLTGRKRLPGFDEKWQLNTLTEMCSLKSGIGITAANIDGNSPYRCYGGNGLRGFTTEYTHDGQFALIGRQGALCGNVLSVQGKFYASEHALVVTAKAGADIAWLTYTLGRMNLNQYSESSAQPGLSARKLSIIEIFAPPSKAEQTAIAEILSDMDAEIAGLETKLAKARQIKQGMMQQLLTGRIRLVAPEVAA